MYEVIISKKSEKFLDKLNSKDRQRIINAFKKLRIRPQAYIERLVDSKLYKFRIGEYRAFIDIYNDKLIILVIKIGHRKNIYKE